MGEGEESKGMTRGSGSDMGKSGGRRALVFEESCNEEQGRVQ